VLFGDSEKVICVSIPVVHLIGMKKVSEKLVLFWATVSYQKLVCLIAYVPIVLVLENGERR
jgi:hypothetical protein